MTYAEAAARILALRGGERAGMRPGLERIEAMLDAIGRPEQALTIAQVGGTNGKGSISAMLAAILQAAGRRVGLYTSPHLAHYRERIRVDGRPISESDFVDGVDALVDEHGDQLGEGAFGLAQAVSGDVDPVARDAVVGPDGVGVNHARVLGHERPADAVGLDGDDVWQAGQGRPPACRGLDEQDGQHPVCELAAVQARLQPGIACPGTGFQSRALVDF